MKLNTLIQSTGSGIVPVTAFSITALLTAGFVWFRQKIKRQHENQSFLEIEYNF